MKFSAHFGLDPDDILCATSEPIDLLLGVDAAGLLLDKVMQLNGRDIKPASWAPNIFLYGSDASCKFSLVGRMNVNYPVDNIRDRFSAQGVFYFSSQEKYASCEQILLAGSYTHHVGTGNSIVSYAEPPARQLKQTKKCNPTPPSDVFSTDDLEKIVEKASVLRNHQFQASSLPKFVSMHKIFLVACALCLFHSDGICATIAASRLLDDGQITIDNLKTINLCSDCLRRSRCCPYCQSLNREISLEKRRENSLLLKAIRVMTNAETGSKYLSVTYPLSCDPEIAYHPTKSNYVQARHNAVRLRKRLIKLNLLESFDRRQLSADIQSWFCEILQGSQVVDILAQVHCCSTINFVLKPSSESTPLRIVTNASFFHQSKSLNQNVIPGLTELPPIHHLLIEFFLSPWIACFDISKCYRAIHTSEATTC